MEVKALYGDGQIIAASNSIDTFFKTISKENNDTPEYREMVKLLTTIKEEEKKVNTQYEEVIKSNDASLAKKYLNEYAKAREASAIHKIISIEAVPLPWS